MSIIGVSKFNRKVGLYNVVQSLVKVIQGEFEALNFSQNKHGKICYLRLSEKLDPAYIIDKINRTTRYTAFIPKKVPELPMTKKGKIPLETRLAFHIPTDQRPEQVMAITHTEILIEMQSKYIGLFNLSKKTGHKLLDNIARTVYQRLKQIVDGNPTTVELTFQLSKSYRKLHPHFGDFQLVLSSLHALQDAAGATRAQLHESDLTKAPTQPYEVDNLPYSKVLNMSAKYSDRIIKKVSDHVNSLKCELKPGDSEEDIARKKVRAELKKLSQYLPLMVKQVISNHFVPLKSPYHRMRIYGEPLLPSKEELAPFLKQHRGFRPARSERMFNMLLLKVPLSHYDGLIEMDGTEIGGAKLVIRSSEVPLYKVPATLLGELQGGTDAAARPQHMCVDEWTEDVAT